MRYVLGTICVILAAAAIGSVDSTQPASRAARPDTISVDQQLRLKRKVLLGQESVIAVLQNNRRNWDNYSPEQRALLRQKAYAFRQADSIQREQMLDAWQKFISLSDSQKEKYRQRAMWLTAVVAELSPQQKADLLKMSPADRAAKLVELKKQLEAQGKLPPTTQPAE